MNRFINDNFRINKNNTFKKVDFDSDYDNLTSYQSEFDEKSNGTSILIDSEGFMEQDIYGPSPNESDNTLSDEIQL